MFCETFSLHTQTQGLLELMKLHAFLGSVIGEVIVCSPSLVVHERNETHSSLLVVVWDTVTSNVCLSFTINFVGSELGSV